MLTTIMDTFDKDGNKLIAKALGGYLPTLFYSVVIQDSGVHMFLDTAFGAS